MKKISSLLTGILLITFATSAFSGETQNIFDIDRETLNTLDENFPLENPEPTASQETNFVRNDLKAAVKWEIIPITDISKGLFQTSKNKASQTKEEFCKNMKEPDYFKNLILEQKNRLSFRNAGGIFNGGVCWWHSLLNQRQTYLTVYKPELPKPSKEQVLEIFSKYFWGNSVAEIPGYENFYDFSLDWHKLLQKKLNDWQISDGILGSWINGLTGSSKVSAKELKTRMNKLSKEVNEKNRIVWQKLQFPGVTAHAWLVVKMNKTNSGYRFTVLDSNYSSEFNVNYSNGDTSTRVSGYPNFVGYTQHLDDFSKIKRAHKKYCK